MLLHVDKELGTVIYYNHADFAKDTLKMSVNWLESANLRKVNGKWKISFLHSTERKHNKSN